jgi:hypothetical protein
MGYRRGGAAAAAGEAQEQIAFRTRAKIGNYLRTPAESAAIPRRRTPPSVELVHERTEDMIEDHRPSIAELRAAQARHDESALISAAPLLLEVAAAVLEMAGTPCYDACDSDTGGHVSGCPTHSATRRLQAALTKVRP